MNQTRYDQATIDRMTAEIKGSSMLDVEAILDIIGGDLPGITPDRAQFWVVGEDGVATGLTALDPQASDDDKQHNLDAFKLDLPCARLTEDENDELQRIFEECTD